MAKFLSPPNMAKDGFSEPGFGGHFVWVFVKEKQHNTEFTKFSSVCSPDPTLTKCDFSAIGPDPMISDSGLNQVEMGSKSGLGV